MTLFRNALKYALLSFVISIALVGSDLLIPSIHLINLKGRDFFFHLKYVFFAVPDEAKKIVLIALDDETLEKLSTRWPYPRSFYAQILDRLKPHQPKAIGFDLVFSGNDFSEGSDQIFSKALTEAGNVVIAAHKSKEGEVGPSPLIRQSAWRVGIVDKPRDQDRVIRRFYPIRKFDDGVARSWELELLSKAYPEKIPSEKIRENNAEVIDYRVSAKEIQKIPFWKVLNGEILSGDVHDKIVLIGLTSETFHDTHSSPLGSMPGIVINANGVLSMMTGHFFAQASWLYQCLLIFLAVLVTFIVTFSGTALLGFLSVIFMALLFFGASFFLFLHQIVFDVWLINLGMFVVLIGILVYREWQLFFENLRLREESSRDPLTGFYSRRFMELKLKSEVGKLLTSRGGMRNVKEVSVVMIDLDNFKLVNDSFGHGEGDRVLRTMAESVRSSVRKEEVICRYGGDEFCVILSNTNINDAAKFAEKLRQLIANNPDLAYRTASGTDTIRVTASIGVSSVAGSKALEPGGLLKAADQALYRAKKGGRNRVCVFDPATDVIEEEKR